MSRFSHPVIEVIVWVQIGYVDRELGCGTLQFLSLAAVLTASTLSKGWPRQLSRNVKSSRGGSEETSV